ncbi:S-layer homology domain-containing protein [Lysinibacillus fusiformis]|uniref:S-layer homology domain-containing protein n=1 Tax=Lysinibacillus fusiformis TaxID=28031 RepID=UPI002D76DFBA|nr:S-layer homology domain-containing protein [Lysinibacillus fusiformis]WRS97314.1 S-layer homology domain-containing protein [Lysinibacillus fusiformis]
MLHKKSSNNNLMIKALAGSVMTAAMVIPVTTENVQAAPVTKTTFKDVPKSHWAYESIKQVAEKGLVTGYEDGTYKPSAQVTRAEFATFLARVFESNERATVSFNDISDTHWANEAIQEGLAVGFILASDYANNKFEPNKPMTRGEMSRWLANGLVHANADYGKAIEEMANSSLTLIPIPEFYGGGVNKKDLPYIGVALGTGLLSGYEDFTFKPNGNTTRAEVATILIRFKDAMGKAPSDFIGLQELREVANTGTNILTLTNYEKSRFNDTSFWYKTTEKSAKEKNMSVEEYVKMLWGEAFKLPVEGEVVGGFEDVLGKPYTLNNKRAVNTIERAIFVDTRGSQAKGIYKDMFFNPNGRLDSAYSNRNYYYIYYEYTTTPSQNTTLSSLYNGSVLGQIADRLVDSEKAKQFGIITPRTTDGWYYEEVEKGVFKKITYDFFSKDKKVRYWAVQTVGKVFEGSISGMTDDGSRYHYEIIE